MPTEHDQATGGESIVAEHAELSDLVSRIRSAIERGPLSEAKHLLLRLGGLYESHFRHEEQIMERIGYPGIEDHRRDHRELSETLAGINQVLQFEDLHGISPGIARHLETTLRHTIEIDQRFIEFLQCAPSQS